MQRPDLTLIGEVLLSYGLQAAVCLMVTFVLADFARKHQKTYLKWWAWSWVMLFVYLLTAMASLSGVGLLRYPADDWRRIVVSSLSMTAGLLQPLFLFIGTYEQSRGVETSRSARNRWLFIVILVGVAIGVASTWSSHRLLIRLGARGVVACVAFVMSAVMVFRPTKSGTSLGRIVLGWGCIAYGVQQVHPGVITLHQTETNSVVLYGYYLGFADLLLQVMIGLGMMTWHLESERLRTQAALEALEQSQAGLKQAQKMEVVGRLAGGVAHDFNNLMTVMYGATETLTELHPPGSPGRESVDQIEAALDRAKGLTSQLLSFSRKQVAQMTRLDLCDTIRTMESLLRRLVGSPVALALELPSHPTWVVADQSRVTQVVMNLVVNARDAMPNGGRLLIRLHEVDMDAASAERLHVVAGPFIVMDVIDEGVGMSQETQSHLFEPFFTTKPVGQGTGLGLSTVYGIVKASDGAIEVHSQEGAGTTMSVFWPRAAAPASTPPGERAAASPARVRPRVLIVEDDEAIRALLVRALEQNGYIVVTASDGDEGIAILKTKGKFDLLLTDLVMQGTGGAGVVAEARALAPTMKIVVASGFVGDRKAQGLPDDVVWLQKPFSAKDLLALLRPLLAGA